MPEAERVAGLPDTSSLPPHISRKLEAVCSREMRSCIKERKGSNTTRSSSGTAQPTEDAGVAPRLDDPRQMGAAARGTSSARTTSMPSRSSGPGSRAKGDSNSSSSSSSSRWNLQPQTSPTATAARPESVTVGPMAASGTAGSTSGSSSTGSAPQGGPSADAPQLQLDQLPQVKLRFRVPQSRLAFGIPDPTGLLRYEQAFFQPLIDAEATVISGYAVVVSALH